MREINISFPRRRAASRANGLRRRREAAVLMGPYIEITFAIVSAMEGVTVMRMRSIYNGSPRMRRSQSQWLVLNVSRMCGEVVRILAYLTCSVGDLVDRACEVLMLLRKSRRSSVEAERSMNHWVFYHPQVTLKPDTHVSRLRASPQQVRRTRGVRQSRGMRLSWNDKHTESRCSSHPFAIPGSPLLCFSPSRSYLACNPDDALPSAIN